MDEGLKKRLIGAAVLSSLAVIFVPMLFEEPPPEPPALPPLPQKPALPDFATEMLRDEVPEITPLAPRNPPPAIVEPAPAVAAVAPSKPSAPPPPTGVEPPPRPQPVAETPAPAKPLATAGAPAAWVIQVGSFSKRDNAGKLVEKLRAARLPTPDPEPVSVNGQRFYRVQVGPVIERGDAERLASRVDSVSGTKSTVRRYP
jgi:DedD protein